MKFTILFVILAALATDRRPPVQTVLADAKPCNDSRAAAPAPMDQATYDAWRRPAELVAALELRAGDVVADVGAGDGYLTGRLAAAVGPSGRVVATDVDMAALWGIALRGSPGVAVRLVAADDPGLEPATYDLVLLAQVDHLLRDRADYLRQLVAALAPGGRIVVSNRIQHRTGLVAAVAAAGLHIARELPLPGQFLLEIRP